MANNQVQKMVYDSETFSSFYKTWLLHLQVLSDKLKNNTTASSDADSNNTQLIQRVLCHYAEYYEGKARIVWEDTFFLFSPPWLTSFEKIFLWVGGFKPSLVFTLMKSPIFDMVSESFQNLQLLKAETVREERNLTNEFATVQESIGSHPMANLVKQYGRLVDREVSEFDEAAEEMRESMALVVLRADNLRRKTVVKVVEILNVNHSMEFLAVVANYQLEIRSRIRSPLNHAQFQDLVI